MDTHRILVAEDDALVAADLRESLEAMGHSVAAVVPSGDEAPAAAREQSAELAILDIRMPGTMDGIQAGRRIRETLGIPVIYLTGHSDEGTLKRAKATKPMAYLLKPFDPRELHTAIEIAVGRHALEREIQRGQEQWLATLTAIGEGVLSVDPTGGITFLNAEAERLIGVEPGAAVGRNARDVLRLVDESTGETIADPLRKAMEERTVVELPDTAVLLRPDGVRIPVADRASPIVSDGGELIGGVMVLRDIRRIRRAQEERRLSEARYRLLFNASPVPLHISTLEEGRVVDVNESFLELFDLRRTDVIGQREPDLGLWEAEARETAMRRIRDGQPVRALKTRVLTRRGATRHVELYCERLELDREALVLTMIHDVTERLAFEEELERLALEDTLTGLPNRRLFRTRLEHALIRSRRQGHRIAVLFMDLDRFKVVNDTLGHSAGDELLAEVGRRIRGCFRDEDTVARLGGDEFAVVLEEVRTSKEAEEAARRVERAVSTPLEVNGVPVRLSVSVGVALGDGVKRSVEDLLRFSDIAMYRAKNTGRGTRFYDPALDSGKTRRLHMENELHQALDREELSLRFQPTVRLDTGEVVGAEVLVRWEHPDRGTLAPAEFVPLAEEIGLIVPLGRWIFSRACRHLAAWENSLRPASSPFIMSVNLSPRQLTRRQLAAEIDDILREEGASPSRMQVEITESAVVQALGPARELKEIGLRLAVDDFGTGYSPFTYLKDLDVDALKIDRSFVGGLGTNPVDAVITRTILRFAEGLGLSVVAEGVETSEHRRLLGEFGCRLAQGLLFHGALPPTEFEALLGEPPALPPDR